MIDSIPPWVWGLLGLTGVNGLMMYVLARLVVAQNRTIDLMRARLSRIEDRLDGVSRVTIPLPDPPSVGPVYFSEWDTPATETGR